MCRSTESAELNLKTAGGGAARLCGGLGTAGGACTSGRVRVIPAGRAGTTGRRTSTPSSAQGGRLPARGRGGLPSGRSSAGGSMGGARPQRPRHGSGGCAPRPAVAGGPTRGDAFVPVTAKRTAHEQPPLTFAELAAAYRGWALAHPPNTGCSPSAPCPACPAARPRGACRRTVGHRLQRRLGPRARRPGPPSPAWSTLSSRWRWLALFGRVLLDHRHRTCSSPITSSPTMRRAS